VRVINLKDGDGIADVSCVAPDALAETTDEADDEPNPEKATTPNSELDNDAASDVVEEA